MSISVCLPTPGAAEGVGAIDGVRLGYQVIVPLALTRFVELREGDTTTAVEQMREAGVRLIE